MTRPLDLKQPKLLIDVSAGAIALLGLVGCFHESALIKRLSLSALLAGTGTLAANGAMAELYATHAQHVLERDLSRGDRQLEQSRQDVARLTRQNQAWESHAAQQQLRIQSLETELAEEQVHLVEAIRINDDLSERVHDQAARYDSQIESLRQRIDTLQQQLAVERQQVFLPSLSELMVSKAPYWSRFTSGKPNCIEASKASVSAILTLAIGLTTSPLKFTIWPLYMLNV